MTGKIDCCSSSSLHFSHMIPYREILTNATVRHLPLFSLGFVGDSAVGIPCVPKQNKVTNSNDTSRSIINFIYFQYSQCVGRKKIVFFFLNCQNRFDRFTRSLTLDTRTRLRCRSPLNNKPTCVYQFS